MAPSDLVRTNIRMSRELHARLKRAAIDQNETVEAFAAKVLERALLAQVASTGDTLEAPTRTPAERRQFLAWAAQLRRQADEVERTALDSPGALLERLAVSVALSAPIPMVVKREAGRIVIANPAYLRLLKPDSELSAAMKSIRNLTIEEVLGIRIEGALASTKGPEALSESFEHLHIEDRNINVLALRFLFETSTPTPDFYVGDISFETQLLDEARTAGHLYDKGPPPTLTEIPYATELWSAYFRNMTTPALIKEVQGGRIVWANRSFMNLVGEFCERTRRPLPNSPVGKTSVQLFGDYADPRIEDYDSAASRGIPVLGAEMLLNQERIGARFPIYTESREIEYVGIVSSSAGRFPRSFMNDRPLTEET